MRRLLNQEDLNKIVKFLLRQTYKGKGICTDIPMDNLKNLSFWVLNPLIATQKIKERKQS